MFSIEMLPAAYGDCLWIEYGDPAQPRRILIDGGIAATYDSLVERIKKVGRCRFDLLVVSHVDADHIEGVVKLLANLPQGVEFGDIWFNGWKHLPASPRSRLGGPQGEMLTSLIAAGRWNAAFEGGPVAVPDSGELPSRSFDGLTLTLLSPGLPELARLRPKWQRECKEAGLIPGSLAGGRDALLKSKKLRPRRLGTETVNLDRLASAPFEPDSAPANGSSIALLAEYEGKRVLLAADAFPTVVAASIGRLLEQRGASRLKLDAYKVAHHGSVFNTSPDLLAKVRCGSFLFSTNGAIFGHPDQEAVARILLAASPQPSLYFNYCSEENKVWRDGDTQRRFRYRAIAPEAKGAGLRVEL